MRNVSSSSVGELDSGREANSVFGMISDCFAFGSDGVGVIESSYRFWSIVYRVLSSQLASGASPMAGS